MQSKSAHTGTVLPMMIIGILFFIFGFVTWLNGSLIPFLKIICDLNEFQALFVTFAFYIAYTVMALPMSSLLRRYGYKDGMAIGLAIMTVGALLFIPAALSTEFFIFLIALFTLGTGLTVLQTASNPYVVYLGPKESAAMRISIMGLINKGAGVIVPMLFTAIILSGLGDLAEGSLDDAQISELSSRLIVPYLMMAAVLIALIALIRFSSLPDLDFERDDTVHSNDQSSILHFPRLILGAIALFAYVGIEVIAGDTIGLYGQTLGVSDFASLTSYTMVFMVIGYLVGVITIPRLVSQEKALLWSSLAGVLFIFGIVFGSSESTSVSELLWGWSGAALLPDTVAYVALLGLSNALVWPAIWPLALEGLGKFTAQGSALLIMAISGGAVLPLIFGKIAHISENIQLAYGLGIICYLIIFLYALKGHKITSWKEI